ncbi:unnamed protein product [Brassicogethes aeneus]|uniref:Uncharacterized protein n=1 Tax=Brassicogethes aeneus TaxID=1431903 RepID=A0A9P0FP46_BRAAE|nr:unnamed protein product [Brassicogethes aeneus]
MSGRFFFKLKHLNTETDISEGLRSNLLETVTRRLGGFETSKIVAKACFLDPRFKKVGFGTENNADNAQKWVTEELKQLIASRNADNEPVEMYAEPQTLGNTSNSEDDIWLHFDNKLTKITQISTPSSMVILIVRQYLEMATLERKRDPLEFWTKHKLLFPEIMKRWERTRPLTIKEHEEIINNPNWDDSEMEYESDDESGNEEDQDWTMENFSEMEDNLEIQSEEESEEEPTGSQEEAEEEDPTKPHVEKGSNIKYTSKSGLQWNSQPFVTTRRRQKNILLFRMKRWERTRPLTIKEHEEIINNPNWDDSEMEYESDDESGNEEDQDWTMENFSEMEDNLEIQILIGMSTKYKDFSDLGLRQRRRRLMSIKNEEAIASQQCDDVYSRTTKCDEDVGEKQTLHLDKDGFLSPSAAPSRLKDTNSSPSPPVTESKIISAQEIFYDDSKRTPSGYLAWRLRTVVRNQLSPQTDKGLKRRSESNTSEEESAPKKRNWLTEDEKAAIKFLKYACPKTQKDEI